jgi:hypothetical protein
MKIQDNIMDTAICTDAYLNQLSIDKTPVLCQYALQVWVSRIQLIKKRFCVDGYYCSNDASWIEVDDLEELRPIFV